MLAVKILCHSLATVAAYSFLPVTSHSHLISQHLLTFLTAAPHHQLTQCQPQSLLG